MQQICTHLNLIKLIGLEKIYPPTLEKKERKVSFREKTVNNILAAVEESKNVRFERVLFALGIRYVGETVAKLLAKQFKNIDALMNAGFDELTAVNEIGDRIAQSVIDYFGELAHLQLIHDLRYYGLKMAVEESESNESENKLDNAKFVVSGVFKDFSRNEIKDMIEKFGGKNVSSVSSATNYLLAGENMGPSKLEKANKLGIEIISINDFLDMIT